jgi:GntR family transcriptional repressor for pyruvate dehydrogenase complex
MARDFTPLRTKRTFELIVDDLKERIFAGEYRPGDRLPAERALAERLRVGRTSIREAYRALELMGILEIRKGSDGGAYILEPCQRSATEAISDVLRVQNLGLSALAEARIFIEKGVAELAAERAGPDDLARVQVILARASDKIAGGQPTLDESLEFHMALAEACQNPVLATVHASVVTLMRLWLKRLRPTPEASRRELDEHRLLLAAVVQRRPAEASRLMEDHLRDSKERLERVVAGSREEVRPVVATRQPMGS